MRTYTVLLWCLLMFPGTIAHAQRDEKIRIAAAADLKFALDSVIHAFSKINRGEIDVTYGSSGKLFEQITHGAPFDLFFSADIAFPRQLKEKGLAISEVYPYGIGRIVIWSNKMDPSKMGIKALLQPSVRKIAIANPLHAPYGKRAEEAMKYYSVYESVRTKLVLGENISQAAQFITSGAADLGIIALSLALSPSMKSQHGWYYIIPEESHQPLLQGSVITSCAKGNTLAVSFHEFIKSDEAAGILRHFGFTRP